MSSRIIAAYLFGFAVACGLASVAFCQDVSRQMAKPIITVTEVPPYDCGGPDKRATISGRVSRVSPKEYRLMIYAFACDGIAYVQPTRAIPYVELPNGSFQTQIYLGQVYWVAVVRRAFEPKAQLYREPELDNNIVAIVKVEGRKK
jgi:hypothetical protein